MHFQDYGMKCGLVRCREPLSAVNSEVSVLVLEARELTCSGN